MRADAMPGGGTLKIMAANTALSEDDVWMVKDVGAGKYVRISVQDTGVGMNQGLIGVAQSRRPLLWQFVTRLNQNHRNERTPLPVTYRTGEKRRN